MQKQATRNQILNQSGAIAGNSNAKEKQRVCEQCATPIPTGAELCPGCGTYVEHGHCSFCDFDLEEDDVFCPECGNPRSGITCPACGTLSFRSFCSHCNTPLDDLAQGALDESATDPTFIEMQSLAVTLNDIERALERRNVEQSQKPDRYTNNLLAQYSELLTAPKAAVENKTPVRSTEEQAALYQRKALEMQTLMDSLKPEEGETPQTQRNYFSARKLSGNKQETFQPITGWECNYCRCVHRHPSECIYRELGGKWIYKQ